MVEDQALPVQESSAASSKLSAQASSSGPSSAPEYQALPVQEAMGCFGLKVRCGFLRVGACVLLCDGGTRLPRVIVRVHENELCRFHSVASFRPDDQRYHRQVLLAVSDWVADSIL